LQEWASNRLVLLRSKGAVVNDYGKGGRTGRQVSIEKMSESKPYDDASLCRIGTAKIGDVRELRDQSGRHLFTVPMAVGV